VRRPPDGGEPRQIEDAVIEGPTRIDRMTDRRGGPQEGQMTGSTRTIQQPAKLGSILAAVGMAAAVLSAAAAFAWGSANLGKATQPVAAPAPIYAPAVRDHGARDDGSNAGRIVAPRPR
jgi:hypothetical protein